MEKPNDTEKLDVLYMFVKKVLDEENKGRSLVFVNDKLLEWVDEQVDAGKYYSRSHAIECAVAEIKQRGKSKGSLEVLGHNLPGHLTRTKKSLGWIDIDETNRRFAINYLLALDKVGLQTALKERFGDNLQAKIDCLKKLMKDGSETLFQKLVYMEVLNELYERKEKESSEREKTATKKEKSEHSKPNKARATQTFS